MCLGYNQEIPGDANGLNESCIRWLDYACTVSPIQSGAQVQEYLVSRNNDA